jgi:hypothetical protein
MASERGSALFWWVIILLLFFLIAASLAYVQYSDVQTHKAEIVRLRDEMKREKESLQKAQESLLSLSNQVGWQPGENQATQPKLLDERFEKLRGRFNTIGASDKSLESALAKMEVAFETLGRKADEDARALKESRTSEETARNAYAEQAKTLNERIAQLENEKKEVEQRADTQKKSADEEIDKLRNQVTTSQNAMKEAAETARKEKNELINKSLGLEANLKQTSEKIRGIKESDRPDAEVVSVSDELGLVYLDLGRRHGLKPGTTFEVYTRGKGGEKLHKGRVQVRTVSADSSVAGVLEEADRYNPIVTGDLAQNILFDRSKPPTFVILGTLPGRYSLQEAKRILEGMGARVDTRVTVDTDFLVLGRKESEDAVPFEERPEYKNALQYNVQIIGFNELRNYLEP